MVMQTASSLPSSLNKSNVVQVSSTGETLPLNTGRAIGRFANEGGELHEVAVAGGQGNSGGDWVCSLTVFFGTLVFIIAPRLSLLDRECVSLFEQQPCRAAGKFPQACSINLKLNELLYS